MSSRFSYDNRCPSCGNRGHVFWRESGYRDQDERITAIWGESRSWRRTGAVSCRQERGPVVCARCGGSLGDRAALALVGRAPENEPDEDLAVMTAYVTVTPLDTELIVRIYQKGELEAEARLSRRRALLLAQDALAVALIDPGGPAGPDGRVLEAAGKRKSPMSQGNSHNGSYRQAPQKPGRLQIGPFRGCRCVSRGGGPCRPGRFG